MLKKLCATICALLLFGITTGLSLGTILAVAPGGNLIVQFAAAATCGTFVVIAFVVELMSMDDPKHFMPKLKHIGR